MPNNRQTPSYFQIFGLPISKLCKEVIAGIDIAHEQQSSLRLQLNTPSQPKQYEILENDGSDTRGTHTKGK